MMESILFHFSSLSSFLAKGKSSKSISLILSHVVVLHISRLSSVYFTYVVTANVKLALTRLSLVYLMVNVLEIGIETRDF